MEYDELMRHQYWYLYQKVIYTSYYYGHYRTRSTRINHAITALLLTTSLAGVSGLWIWQKCPNVWAVVAACLQIVSACTFFLPYAEQVWAIDHLLPELDMMINEISRDWNTLTERTGTEINDLIFHYEQRLIDMEQKYIGATHFPESNRCKEYAIRDRDAFNLERFDIESDNNKQEDITNA